MKVETELYGVLPFVPREAVDHLIVAVHAVTGDAAGRTELGEATHQNDRQTLVGRARTRVEPDRTRCKTLVPREEALREPVPAIPQVVNFVRSDRVYVRKRNQLHSRRRVGVEARQLTTASGQRQGERLDAVAKEISPRELIGCIEVLIDLRDKAGQPVKRGRNHRAVRSIRAAAAFSIPTSEPP